MGPFALQVLRSVLTTVFKIYFLPGFLHLWSSLNLTAPVDMADWPTIQK
jgi:hypothetical protein